jgi:hypothetical protein
MESLNMNVRHFVVAVSAAAILAGSSYGALADYHKKSYSKGESYSTVESKGSFHNGSPVAETEQHQKNSSFTNQSDGGAGADAGTTGGAIAGSLSSGLPMAVIHTLTPSLGGSASGAAAWGSTDGSSCAGSGCGN